MGTVKTLIFVPTYNERENAPRLCKELLVLRPEDDILFLDDNSPDGTGKLLDEIASENSRVQVIHRSGKQGVGSAHYTGIKWAYEHGYQLLVTMDADYTHRPEDISKLLSSVNEADIVVGSRHMTENSLPGWNIVRKFLTKAGHFLTKTLLQMEYDATGALRLYRLDTIPLTAFDLVGSKGYSFFFESLYILHQNGFRIAQIPIALPARTYGSSKMSYKEVINSVMLLAKTFLTRCISPDRYKIAQPLTDAEINTGHTDPQNWDTYWCTEKNGWGIVYDFIAALYRKYLIRPTLNHFIRKTFHSGEKLLHAGSGGGEVDVDIRQYADITPLDISVNALNKYRRVNGNVSVIHGSIFEIPSQDEAYDGIYNLGVMEHFTEEDIRRILKEFSRVLKPSGKIVLFWPPEFGVSVTFFKLLRKVIRLFKKEEVKFHPDEITRLQSRAHLEKLLTQSDFTLVDYYFGPRDMFTQVAVVAAKKSS